MKIEVNQNHPELWGKLGVQEARTAVEKLSGDSFKQWVLLALNQDGYIWSGDLEPRTFHELTDYGYLLPLDNGNFLFLPDGEAGGYDIPAEWGKITGLYGSTGQQDLFYIRNRLKAVCLDDRLEDILTYWAEKYSALQKIDHSKARNNLKYDFSVAVTWWLWDNFRFQSGDVLEVGEGAKRLWFHDDAFKSKIQTGVRDRKITQIIMTEAAANYWNTAFAARKVEIPLDIVGKILKARKQYEGGIL